MEEIVSLIVKIFPLYMMVAAGFVIAKLLKIDRLTIVSLLIYFLAPVVVFYGVAIAPVDNALLLLPVIFFVIALFLSLVFFEIGKLFWHGTEKNLLSASAGSGNTGYFGLPLVLALTGEAGLSVAAFLILGGVLYESSRSYYIIAKSHISPKKALMELLKLPLVYAFLLGLLVNRIGVTFDPTMIDAFAYIKGAYVVLGMMVIGIVLASATRAHFDVKFTVLAFIAKFIAFPAIMGAVILFDIHSLHLFSSEVHMVMLLMSIVPIAANLINYAALLKAHPEKAALTVMASTVFALVYIPLFIAVFMS